MVRLVTLILAAFFLIPCGALLAQVSPDRKKVTIDEEKVYLGSPANFKKPAVVNLGKIFKETEPYRQIRREKLDPKDPKYRILIVEANRIAKKAMEKVRDESGYDLIVEEGHITIEDEDVPDITDRVIEAIE